MQSNQSLKFLTNKNPRLLQTTTDDPLKNPNFHYSIYYIPKECTATINKPQNVGKAYAACNADGFYMGVKTMETAVDTSETGKDTTETMENKNDKKEESPYGNIFGMLKPKENIDTGVLISDENKKIDEKLAQEEEENKENKEENEGGAKKKKKASKKKTSKKKKSKSKRKTSKKKKAKK